MIFTKTARAGGVAAATILLASCSPFGSVAMSVDYPYYDTLASAVGGASVIVQARYVDSAVELLYPEISQSGDPLTNPQLGVPEGDVDLEAMAVVTTVSNVEITHVFKGDVTVGDVVRVSQLGGSYDGVAYEEEGANLLAELDADEVMLFLVESAPGNFDLINPQQGLYVVDGEDIFPPDAKGAVRDSEKIADIVQIVQSEK